MSRRFFHCLTSFLCGALLTGGCGSISDSNQLNLSGGTSASATNTSIPSVISVSGKVVLPPGFGLPLSSLQAVSSSGSASVSQDGSFVLPVGGTGSGLILVVSSDDKLVLMGFVAGGDSNARLDTGSTATALLYFGLGGFTLPADKQARLRQLIQQDPNFNSVVQAILTSLSQNPTALTDGDPALLAAIQAAIKNIIGAINPRFAANISALSGSSLNKITILSPASQSGASVAVNQNQGLDITNYFRRSGFVHCYQTAHVPLGSSQSSPIQPVETTTTALPLPTVEGLGGVFDAIGAILKAFFLFTTGASQSPPYAPQSVSLSESQIPLNSADSSDQYAVLLVSPSIKLGSRPPAVFSQISSNQRDGLLQEFGKLEVRSLLFDVAIPALGSVLFIQNPQGTITLSQQDAISAALLQGVPALTVLVTKATTDPSSIGPQDFASAAQAFITTVATTQSGRDTFIGIFIQLGLISEQGQALAGRALRILAGANIYINVLNSAIAGVDLGAVLGGLTTTDPFIEWDINVAAPAPQLVVGDVQVTHHFTSDDTPLVPTDPILRDITGTFNYHLALILTPESTGNTTITAGGASTYAGSYSGTWTLPAVRPPEVDVDQGSLLQNSQVTGTLDSTGAGTLIISGTILGNITIPLSPTPLGSSDNLNRATFPVQLGSDGVLRFTSTIGTTTRVSPPGYIESSTATVPANTQLR